MAIRRHPFPWRRGLAGRGDPQISEGFETQEYGIFLKGIEYGGWITENGRAIDGIASGDLIESFPHAIEWILRELLAAPTSKINTASFDVAYTSLSGWEIGGVLMDIRPAKEHIENLLIQSKSRMFKDHEGKHTISVNQATYPEILLNGNLESLDGADDFSDWTEQETNEAKVESETTIVHSGNQSVKLTNGDDAGEWAKIHQTRTLIAERNYIFTVYTRRDGGTGQGRIGIYETDTPDYIIPEAVTGVTDTDWVKMSIPFTTGAGITTVRFDLVINGDVDTVCYFDDASLKLAPITLYDDYKFDKDSNIFDMKVDKTPLNDVLNNVRVNYKKNPGNGELMAETWINCIREFSGSLLNEDLDDSEVGVDVDDGTDFNTTTRKEIIYNDEISTVTGIAANTLTVTRGAHSSKARTHDDNDRIDILLVDSSDNDSVREDLAIQSAYRFRTNKEVIINADMIIDSTTATNLRNHFFDYYRRPRWIIDFMTGLNASDIKISSIIEFDDTVMDDWLKLGGESWLNVKFEVISIRRIDTLTYKIKAIEI